MPLITFWYEFASTYSYPAAMRIDQLAKAEGVTVNWRPFLLGPIFKDQGWSTSPFNIYAKKGAYMWRDVERICSELNLPFQKPNPFPQNGLLAARIATFGMTEGWGAAFSKAVYDAQFGRRQSIDDAQLLAELVQASGGDGDAALSEALTDANKQRLKDATSEAIELGIFGSPFFVTQDNELFWGNDRLDDAMAWSKRVG